ncbi:MAG: DNA-processing protein DprA [Blautia sp.]|nr:DNA-processing protein DprA [Blautia sp.]
MRKSDGIDTSFGEEVCLLKTDYEQLHITKDSPLYPERLRRYPRMPEELYYLGGFPVPQRKTVAIVGARMCSSYGRSQAFQFAKFLSRHGIQIISGLAMGIDAQAHWGALEGNGSTYAVLGNGVDICYPASNRSLYHRILRQGGGILSEYPAGTPPLAHHFPIRNRIISGLADLVLVVEAKEKSGSLITAEYALEQGKAVYAVPGHVNDALSRGTNRLLFDGAGVAYSPQVLLEELGILSREDESDTGQKRPPDFDSWAEEKQKLYLCLEEDKAKGIEEMISETGLALSAVNGHIMSLVVDGFATELVRGQYIRS